MSDEETQFESADAGASDTIPVQAGSVRKGGHIVIKGKPCKVIDISTSKTGKHGHAKCKFVALNIFTGAKQEDMQPAGHNMSAPLVKKVEYSLMDITDDDYFCMMNESGDMKEDLQLLEGNEFIGDMHKKIREAFNESQENGDKEIMVTVLCAMGQEMVIDFKAINV